MKLTSQISSSAYSVLRYRFVLMFVLAGIFFVLNLLFRLSLQVMFPASLPLSFVMLSGLFWGAVNDFYTVFFILILPFLLFFLPGDRFLKSVAGRIYTLVILFVYSSLLVFNCFAEYFFWEEFSSRFNFIAVDYLIYTTEVIQNIVESYPLFWLFTAVFVLGFAIAYLAWLFLRRRLAQAVPGSGFFARLGLLLCFYAAAAGSYFVFDPHDSSKNRFWNEYAKNGVYELFSAYLHNQLDYRVFYQTIDSALAFDIVQKDLVPNLAPALPDNSIVRKVYGKEQEERPNVVVVIIESLGSGKYLDDRPFLTSLEKQSLNFTNLRSTGTRTVRGLEAIMLSIPPTPGNSIVRRPDNHDFYSLATPFKDRGYSLDFIYGGIGFFDNMNDFFEGLGFNVNDKLDFAPENKTFSNAWGQCDGDSYAESIRLADLSYAQNKPFMQVILTTSNHRPFTFPENTVDMPQGTREAAVRYTDYAIEEYMKNARKKPWFENTVFVFMGDHPSSIAGKTEVPAKAYGIVGMIYSPKYVAPAQVDVLCSQIDLAPTLLNIVGFTYESPFFGKDVFTLTPESGRAWVSTYQLLGFVDKDYLVVLDPEKNAVLTKYSPETGTPEKEKAFIEKAIAYYQTAYDMFSQKMLKEQAVKEAAQ